MAITLNDLPTPRPLPHDLVDYIEAMSGNGPLAYDWEDKPHRLVFDLIAALRYNAVSK